MVKITLLGIGMVGKSSLTYRFIDYNAPEDHDPTIEDKFLTVVEIDKKTVTINILDTAGQDDYQSLQGTWIEFGDGFLLVFALDDRSSFDELDQKKAKIDLMKKKNAPIILVGNKSDLTENRKVSRIEAEQKAKKWGVQYMETSAKTDDNCKDIFLECAKNILSSQKTNEITSVDKKCCTIF